MIEEDPILTERFPFEGRACEVCGDPAEVRPDNIHGSHGWLCRACRIATSACSIFHGSPVNVVKLREKIDSLNVQIDQYHKDRNPVLQELNSVNQQLKALRRRMKDKRNRLKGKSVRTRLSKETKAELRRLDERAKELHGQYMGQLRLLDGLKKRLGDAQEKVADFESRRRAWFDVQIDGQTIADDPAFIKKLLQDPEEWEESLEEREHLRRQEAWRLAVERGDVIMCSIDMIPDPTLDEPVRGAIADDPTYKEADWSVVPFATHSNQELAEALGVSQHRVRNARWQHDRRVISYWIATGKILLCNLGPLETPWNEGIPEQPSWDGHVYSFFCRGCGVEIAQGRDLGACNKIAEAHLREHRKKGTVANFRVRSREVNVDDR